MAQMQKKNDKLVKMLAEEREKIKGYEQIAKVHSAYISILLKRLKATKNKPITITSAEVTEALKKYEARALPSKDGFSLYCEENE